MLGEALAPGRQAWLPTRLGRFVLERFSPAAYGPLLLAFVICGYAGAAVAAGTAPRPDIRFLAVLLAATLAFLHLRVADELKDAAIDRLGRPDRPLPRGLVTEAELRGLGWAAMLAGVVLAATLGAAALTTYSIALLYMALSARDFWLGERIRRNIVVYALLHSPIVPLLLAFVWWSQPAAYAGAALGGLLLMVWGIALALEVTRKTVTPAEERPHVETYSGALGQGHAVMLAAGTLAVGCLGAAAYGAEAGITAGPAFLAGAVAILAVGAAARRTRRLSAVRVAASLISLALLLWPATVALLTELGAR